MVTGDYGLTAESIARRVGMVGKGRPKIITGTDLDKMDEQALSKELGEQRDVLFARVSPEDKMKIARALQRNGEVVAVTGDGVNDAPALKAADIGVAMGKEGTDVAKEAADMVLTDDNFASIVAAVEEGRTVYANIRKFVTYILASNVPELIPYLAYVLLRVPLPLTVMQILAVDLGTDLLPALALGLEPPEPGVMENPPRSKKESLLDVRLLGRAYGFLGLMEAAIGMAAYFWFLGRHGWVWGQSLDPAGLVYRQATSIVFASIVTGQVFNVFAARTDVESVFRVGLFRNRWVWLGILWEIALTLVILNVPYLQQVFGTAPLTLADWGFLWAVSPLLLVAEEVRKWLVRRGMSRT
jgi:magnesium-transporting ATPase (P-type)